MNIGDILLKYDTDKNKGFDRKGPGIGHYYGPSYQRIFDNFDRSSQISILEIGVQKGGSLKAWSDYFTNAYVVGVDIVDVRKSEYVDEKTYFICSDVKSPSLLDHAFLANRQFDIIIDDGSHMIDDVIYTVRNFLPRLSVGGFLIIEDCQSKHWFQTITSLLDDKNYSVYFEDLTYWNNNYDDFLIIIKKLV